MNARVLLLVLVAAPMGASGCKGFDTNLQDTQVDYLATARQNFEKGQAAMEDESFNEAIKFFEYVKNKFPYSRYAVLADLAIADSHFLQEEWLESADAYRLFVRFHPRHEKIAYATFRIALSYYNETHAEFLEDWSIPYAQDVFDALSPFPPDEERDQTAVKDAIKAFDEYLERFPDDENVPTAKALRIEARSGLAAHDLYAADFYEKRNKYRGAMWRYLRVADEYSDTPLAAAALLSAGAIAEEELTELGLAKKLYRRILVEHQDAPQVTTATTRLTALDQKIERQKRDGTFQQELVEPWDPRGPGPWKPLR